MGSAGTGCKVSVYTGFSLACIYFRGFGSPFK